MGLKNSVRSAIPSPLVGAYHFVMSHLGAALYRFPSKKIFVIGVTGTKGKSSTVEMLNSIFEDAGYTTAVLNSIRIKVADSSKPNTMRMSMPGRFYIQRFLARAISDKCTVAILEMTSEGARQYRHRAIHLDALIFTNLAPEHIESHGSLQEYADAKFELGKQLLRSQKRPRFIVANAEDPESRRYLQLPVERIAPYKIAECDPIASDSGGTFKFGGFEMSVHLPGMFSLKNALAAATLAKEVQIPLSSIKAGLGKLSSIPGRGERIEMGQNFTVVVDYAHTPDSLAALYDAYGSRKKICVLGATGGGRDMWKRPVMGKLADERCDHVILANEDPYDEDPKSILESLARGMKRAPQIILDRREAIAKALDMAQIGDAVLITGKGTDPSIQIARGKKIPWSDAQVVREELERILKAK